MTEKKTITLDRERFALMIAESNGYDRFWVIAISEDGGCELVANKHTESFAVLEIPAMFRKHHDDEWLEMVDYISGKGQIEDGQTPCDFLQENDLEAAWEFHCEYLSGAIADDTLENWNKMDLPVEFVWEKV